MKIVRHITTIATLAAALAAAGVAAAAAEAPVSAYAGLQTRTIKSLSEQDIAGLLDGQGAGFAKAAELNGYPGPAHTLELQDRLGLKPDQVAASQALMAAHKARARELGAALVDAERKLDALFAGQQASRESIDSATREVGTLQARLRAEHLATHLSQTALLDVHQIARYNVLRGYADTKAAEPAAGTAVPDPTHRPHH